MATRPELEGSAGMALPHASAPTETEPTKPSTIGDSEKQHSFDATSSNTLTPVFTNRTHQQGGFSNLRPTRSYTDGHGYFSEPEPEVDDDSDGPQDVEQQDLERREKSFEVGWDGIDDPMNPKNLKPSRKWMIVIVLAFGSLCVTCTSSLYTITYGECSAWGNLSSAYSDGAA